MTRNNKKSWTVIFINKRQKEAWNDIRNMLDAGYRWQVDCGLNYIINYEEPWKEYKSSQCEKCMDGICLLDVSHQGIGDKTVEILIWFDMTNKTLTPLYCELV